MNNRFLVALFGLGLLMGTARGQTFTSYDYPGAYTTGLGKITAAGDVFGGYNNGPDNCCTYIGRHSFLLIGGLAGTAVSVDVTQAEVSGNQSTLLVAVNPGFLVNGPNDYSGQIGGQYTDSGNNVHGWLRTYAGTSSSFVTIDPPGSVYTRVTGVNDRGDVVGAFTVPGTQHGFLLRKGAYQTIDFPGATFTSLDGINNKGEMIGIYGDAQGVWHGFLLNKGVYTSYDPPGSIHTEIYDVDNLGNVVGLYYAYNPVFAVYTYSGFLLSSKGVFTQIVFPGSFFSDAGGINLSGVIGGAYASASEFNNGTYHGFLRTP